METLAQAVERLARAGYCEAFRAESGRLRAVGKGSVHDPESLVIEEIVRFEGASDPDDQAVVFARLAGFLAGQLPPGDEMMRATLEALLDGHAEPARTLQRPRDRDHGHSHDYDHDHEHGHHHHHH